MTDPVASAPPDWPRRSELAALTLLLGLALCLRLPALARFPPGLHVDEAYNILDARAIRDGWRPLFLPANAGREAAYSYWQALLLGVGGESIFTARLASVLIGMATILALWQWVRGLALPRPRRTAVLAASFLALTLWHVHFSRFGIRSIALPLVVVTLFGLWTHLTEAGPGCSARRRLTAVLGLALVLGLSLYVHPVGRLLWTIPLAAGLARRVVKRDPWPLQASLAAIGGSLLIALPLFLVWARQPWLVLGHVAETSALGAGPAGLAGNLLRALGLFHFAGDQALWRNLSGRPAFDPLSGLVFLAGLAMAIRLAAHVEWARLSLVSLPLLLLPTVVTDAAPNFSRAIGVLLPACFLAGVGLDHCAAWLQARSNQRALGMASVILALTIAGGATIRDYRRWMQLPSAPMAFDDEKAALGQYVAAQSLGGWRVYLSPAMAAHPTVQVMATHRPSAPSPAPRAAGTGVSMPSAQPAPRGFSPSAGLVLPGEDCAGALYVYLRPEAEVAALAQQLRQHEVRARRLELHLWGPGGRHQHQAIAFQVTASDRGGLPNTLRPLVAPPEFGHSLRLRALDRPRLRPGSAVTATLAWDVLRQPDGEWNRSLRLERPNGRVVSQSDGPPLAGSLPTSRWLPGERVIEEVGLHLPADASDGPVRVRVGWYSWRDGRPLPTGSGQALADVDRWTIEHP